MGIRTLIVLLAAIAVIWLARREWRRLGNNTKQTAITTGERMVKCVHCGLHVPLDEALQDRQARYFCCREHLEAGPRTPSESTKDE